MIVNYESACTVDNNDDQESTKRHGQQIIRQTTETLQRQNKSLSVERFYRNTRNRDRQVSLLSCCQTQTMMWQPLLLTTATVVTLFVSLCSFMNGCGVFTPSWVPAKPAGRSQQGSNFCAVHMASNE